MAQPSFIAGLDVGSSCVRLCVGQRAGDGREEGIQIVAAAETAAAGISKGVVTSIDDATSAVSACVERVERMLGAPLSSVWVGVSGVHIISEESRGVVAVSKSDGEISEEDIERAIDGARTVATPLNYEILHVVPKSFSVDGQSGVKNPVGMTGIRLEVDTQIIQGLSSQIKNLTKCIYRTGLDIDDLVLSILATAEAVTTRRQKELGVLVINIGGTTTGYAVFEEGDLVHTGVVPIGSDHITSDIALGLKISIDVAERIKLEYGNASSSEMNKKEEINLEDVGGEAEMVSRKYVAEIIEARVEEIFDKVDKELKKIGKSGSLPAGAILSGGGSKLPGIVDVAKERLRLPAQLGYPMGFISAVDRTNDVSFTTALGLVMWGSHMVRERGGGEGLGNIFSRRGVKNVGGQMKKWLKSLMP